MSRPTRILQKRFVVFCEGDTEYNYIDRMRKNQGVQLVLKPINMHGGGYSNFLKKIRTEASSNCLAKFIIVDADRIMSNEGEMVWCSNGVVPQKTHFIKILETCKASKIKTLQKISENISTLLLTVLITSVILQIAQVNETLTQAIYLC
ncbi:MAG: hypothetical protein PHG16_01390 [Lachnospiraceae bacterium]|nr:hypothetical protein [Lachnospiraceae bacterium]